VTVCVAALFNWNYASAGQPPDFGVGAITVSDRMITAGDIQYEPQQRKLARITDHIYLMVAGDYDLHSEAIKAVQEEGQKNPTLKPFNVAVMYGYQIQAIQRRHAESIYLAPLGLNTDSFLAQQKDMSERFVDTLTNQLQNHHDSEVQALVVGIENGQAHIYSVDHRGLVRSYDDVGFAAIGSGAWHAQSTLMQSGYVKTANLANALARVFSAKKSAEVAPGVGTATDVWLFLKGGAFPVDGPSPVWQRVRQSLDDVYGEYDRYRRALAVHAVNKLQEAINDPPNIDPNSNVTPISAAGGSDSKKAG
jgi:20S proteasome alpha/beta subunit